MVALGGLMGCSLELPGSGSWEAGIGGGPTKGEDAGDARPHTAGAQGDAGLAQASGDAAALERDAGPPGCGMSGRFAVKVTFDVSWVGTQFAGILPIISPGEGELTFVVLTQAVEASATTSQLKIRTCQASVPDFISTLPQERYAVHFSNQVWDADAMPLFSAALMTCREPPCALQSSEINALIGSALSDPKASWPTTVAGGDWPDHDGDGRPGILGTMYGPNDDPRYTYPPADLFLFRRVRTLDLGLRVNLRLLGTRDSCEEISGQIEQGSVDTRGLGCVATGGGVRSSACSGDELRFLDDNLPAWTVRQGTFEGTRLHDTADCDDVRELFGLSVP